MSTTVPDPADPFDPFDPFDPEILHLPAGSEFYRVHGSRFGPTRFNPGQGVGGRFHFFGDPPVPVLCLADTREAAVAETLLHDLPVGVPSRLGPDAYLDAVLSMVRITRDLEVAMFHGLGLRRLGVRATELTDTPARHYPRTRPWAQATHGAGLDGAVWMSRQVNSDRALVVFGDRVAEDDLEVVAGEGMVFASAPGFAWLVQMCAPLQIDVAPWNPRP